MFARFLSVCLAGALLLCVASAQERAAGSKPKITAVAVSDTRPVTASEAHKVFARAEQVLSRVAGTKPGAVSFRPGSTPVQRDQVIGEMSRLFRQMSPKFKATPRMRPISRPVTATGATKTNLENLIRWGAVGPYAPLVRSKSATLTVAEFGDAVGFFMARMADLTHMPSAKFTPGLMKNE